MTALEAKQCTMCAETKPITLFSFRDLARGKRHSRCKTCCYAVHKAHTVANPNWRRAYNDGRREENRERYKRMRERQKAEAPERLFARKRAYHLKYAFGITPTEYDAMVAAHAGKCAICGTTEPGRGSPYFHIDHDHATGVIRGLLCGSCNMGLGRFKDSESLLVKALEYLKERKGGFKV